MTSEAMAVANPSDRAPDLPVSAALAADVARQIRLSVAVSRTPSVISAIQRTMSRHGVGSARSFRALLAVDDALADELIDEATVRETHFFRSPTQLELLRHTILPQFSGRAPDAPARIWSVGCASGEEPYSIAILCEELGLPARIVASDISRKALAEAAEANYGEWSLRNIGECQRRRYFLDEGSGFRLRPELTRGVSFTRVSLGFDRLPAPERGLADFDLIVCRNVLVYLKTIDVSRVAGELFACLAEGGWLLTAATDPPLSKHAPFETAITCGGIAYRKTTHLSADRDPPRLNGPNR